MKSLGTEWVVDVGGCSPAALRDVGLLRRIFAEMVERLSLHVVGSPLFHQFGGEAGVTGIYLLSESHLCFHTFPELASLTLNLYSCRGALAPNFVELLGSSLGEVRVTVTEIARGAQHAEGSG
ncbi:MAG TPA: S-adenosylmethionine decarboxylase [Polyangiaceae bacterium]|nr:S-adenosylmethionine decarboxylase [Polyangiaceae bacterium]